MWLKAFIFLAIIAIPDRAEAQDAALTTLETRDDQRGWEGVGRLDIDGKGFCTAALIQDNLILTAAHCVYQDNGQPIPARDFTFHAGLRGGRAEASRQITSLVAHPDYRHRGGVARPSEVAVDIAVLSLDRPIRRSNIQPFPIADRPRRGDEVGVVSYARARANDPSLQEVCSVLTRQGGVIVMTCDVDYGASGAPVFMVRNGRTSIVSVVSAMSKMGDTEVSLGTSLGEPLQKLLAHYNGIGPARPGGTQRLIGGGERNNTGAKFVRP